MLSNRIRMIPSLLSRIYVVLTICGFLWSSSARENPGAEKNTAPLIGKSYAEWVAACRKLPTNRQLKGRLPAKDSLPLKDFSEFNLVLSAFLERSRTGALSQP